MRKLLYAFGLTSALVFGLAAQAAAPNFAGTWTLDKSKSQGLSQRLQNVESFSWVITQTDKEITIEDKVTGGQPGGGPGGEVTTTSSDKLTLSADGKVLTVVRHSESPRGTQDSTLVFNNETKGT